MSEAAERLAKKVLLIGWDAADWTILTPLLEQGKMPCLAEFLKRGVSGKISTLRPILSPMLWNSVATGKRADLHGIYGFVEPRPDRSGIRPVTSTSRTCKAIWNMLSQNGLRSNVVNWFASFPAEHISGAVVTDRYCVQSSLPPAKRNVAKGAVYPDRLADPLAELVVEPAALDAATILTFLPEAGRVDQEKDDRIRKLARLIAKMSTVHAAACKLMCEEPWDFMAVYYDAIDHFGHTFMPYHPPALEGIDPQDAEVYGPAVTGCYQFQDMMLGAMLQYAGPDTTVLLVSDHGFHSEGARPSTDGYADPVSWHRPYGVVAAAGPGILPSQELAGANLLDVTPTILTLFGLPVGADMDGRPWVEVLDINRPIHKIDTWEGAAENDGAHGEDVTEDPVAAAMAIKQLVELGYVEEQSEDVEKQVESTVRSLEYNQAKALTFSRRREKALPIWESLIAQSDDPSSKLALKLELGSCLMRMGRYETVEEVLYSLLPSGTKSAAVQMMFATLRLHQERGEEALQYLDAASGLLEDKNTQLLAQYGLAYIQTHRLQEAHEHFEAALSGDEENAIARFGMAELCNRRGRHEEAIHHALRSIELAEAIPAGHFQLGVALAKLGLVDEAVVALENFSQIALGVSKGKELIETLRSQPSNLEATAKSTGLPDALVKRLRDYTED